MTDPSAEFSTGTMPQSVVPRSTASKTAAIVAWGRRRAPCPKWPRAAWWLKEVSGPRKAAVTGACRAREAERISR